MTSHRPYLLRALYEWIADNGMTPHLLVDATQAGVRVPPHAVKDGRVVLNVAERAVAQLEMGNDAIRFTRALRRRQPRGVGAGLARCWRSMRAKPGRAWRCRERRRRADAEIRTRASRADSSGGDGDDPTARRRAAEPPRRGHLRIVK